MEDSSLQGHYQTNIDPVLRFYAHFFGENKPDSHQQWVEAEKRLLIKSVDESHDERPFSKSPPRRLGELIELVRMLPAFDSIEFKLLHPLTAWIEFEPCTPLDIERGIAESPEFTKRFNDLFESSVEQIRTNTREMHGLVGLVQRIKEDKGEVVEQRVGPVTSCAYWGAGSHSHLRDVLTAWFWELVLHRDAKEVDKSDYESWDAYFRRVHSDDDYNDLTLKSREFDREAFEHDFDGAILSEMDLSNEVTLTMDRVGRFGLPQPLADFLMQDPVWMAFKRMIDLYEAFYLLHDVAFIVEHNLTQIVLPNRLVSTKHDPQLVREGGVLRQRRSLFWDAIADEEVRAAQIRTCKILNCRKVFWAKAKNQWCCSSRCSNAYHVQNYRYKTPEEKAAYVERQIRRERKRSSSSLELVISPDIKSKAQ